MHTEAIDEILKTTQIMNDKQRKTLVYLITSDKRTHTSRELQRALLFRQPEASQALTFLTSRGWVMHKADDVQCRGRPILRYELAMSIPEILNALKADLEGRICKYTTQCEELDSLAKKYEAALRV